MASSTFALNQTVALLLSCVRRKWAKLVPKGEGDLNSRATDQERKLSRAESRAKQKEWKKEKNIFQPFSFFFFWKFPSSLIHSARILAEPSRVERIPNGKIAGVHQDPIVPLISVVHNALGAQFGAAQPAAEPRSFQKTRQAAGQRLADSTWATKKDAQKNG